MDLAKDTAVTRIDVAPGWYTAELCDRWNFRTPSGGVLMTVALRAMREELADPGLRPVSATTHFCSPVPSGPLEVRVEVLRRGRVAAQVRAQLSSTTTPGPGLEVSATFGRNREGGLGIDFLDATPPAVPGPEAAPNLRELREIGGGFVPPFFANFDTRLAMGKPWWGDVDWQPGAARLGRWYRYLVPQRLADGRLDPLALPPIADTMPAALTQKLGPKHPPFFAPSLDLTLHFLEDTTSEWVLTNAHVRRARAGYATADVEIWDDAGRLLAMGTQMMLLRNLPESMQPPRKV